MTAPLALDDDLLHHLPLPLAQLCLRAHNAKTAQARHHAAYFLWEAALKLLGSIAVVEYAWGSEHPPELTERLHALARPSVGHWREFVRRLVPILADRGDKGFRLIEDFLQQTHHDLPRAAGLDSVLRAELEGESGARSTVTLATLFDRLVTYRNQVIGHGGTRPESFYERLGGALFTGVVELLARCDLLAGRRLIQVEDVRRLHGGEWLVERFVLLGPHARRLESLEWPAAAASLPRPRRLYLARMSGGTSDGGSPDLGRPLHPLFLFDAEAQDFQFFNGRKGKEESEYLNFIKGTRPAREPCDEQPEFLRTLLGTPVGADSEVPSEPPPPSEPLTAPTASEQLGEFELRSELGRGGMGVVYRAWQPSLDREVALKCLLRVGDPKADARFSREIRALGRVEHPHLVKIFASGAQGNQWFYAMELVEGATLAAVCERLQTRASSAAEVDLRTWQEAIGTVCEEVHRAEKPMGAAASPTAVPASTATELAQRQTSVPAAAPAGRLPGREYLRRIAALIRQVAQAAQALHEAGVIHRDIKPGNIMLSPDGSQAVLMDLGLAQLMDETEGRLTRTRQFVGTLRYASPEQVLAVDRLDPRSDVYSLGATLWELLTLRPIYGATDQTPDPELMRRIQYQEPERPRKYHPAVPADLEAIVLKCLEKDPGRRYTSAGELAADLNRWLNDEPVLAHPPTLSYVLTKYVRRHRLAIGAIAGLLLLTVVGTVATLFLINEARLRAWRAQQDAEHANARTELALKDETKARADAVTERNQAVLQRQRAERGEEGARQNLYVAHLRLAEQAWNEGQVGRLRDILQRDIPRPGQKTDLRGFEWYYLWRQAHLSGLWRLREPGQPIRALAVAPRDHVLAVAAKRVKLWDMTTRRVRWTLPEQATNVAALAFSPDGQFLATANSDGTWSLWDAATGRERRTQPARVGTLTSIVFAADGKTLATAGVAPDVRLWDVATGRELRSLRLRSSWASVGDASAKKHLAFAPDGKTLAISWHNITYWDLATGESRNLVFGPEQGATSIAFSPDGQTLAVGNLAGPVYLVNTATGQVRITLSGSAEHVAGLAFDSSGETLVTSGKDGIVTLWEAKTGRVKGHLREDTRSVDALAFGSRGQFLATGSSNGTVIVWDPNQDQSADAAEATLGPVSALAFAPGRRALVSGGWSAGARSEGEVKLWDPATTELRALLQGSSNSVNCVAISPDGKTLAAGLGNPSRSLREAGEVRFWDLATGKPRPSWRGLAAAVTQVAYSPDGKLLVTVTSPALAFGRSAEVCLWNLATGVVQNRFSVVGVINTCTFSRDGRFLAVPFFNQANPRDPGGIKLWDVVHHRERSQVASKLPFVLSVAFSPDGKRLAAGSGDGTSKPVLVHIWDLTTGKERLTLHGHEQIITTVAYAPDGQTLATASWDGTVRLWDLSQQSVRQILRHQAPVQWLEYAPDGQMLATGDGAVTGPGVGHIQLWAARTGKPVAALKGNPGVVRQLCFTPDGQTLVSCGYAALKLWDVPQRCEKAPLLDSVTAVPQQHTARITRLAISPDGLTIATGSADRTVKLWDMTTHRVRLTLEGYQDPITALAFSPDGRRLAAGSARLMDSMPDPTGSKGEVKVWDVATGQLRGSFDTGPRGVAGLAFLPDGRSLVVGLTSCLGVMKHGKADASPWARLAQVRIWDLTTGQLRSTLQDARLTSITDVALSPDGKTLATGTWLSTVLLWDLSAGRVHTALQGYTDTVTGVAFSPDGRTLASVAWDRSIKLWQAATGEELLTLHGHGHHELAVAFSADGQSLATGGDGHVATQGQLKIWRAPRQHWTIEAYFDRSEVGYAREVDRYDSWGNLDQETFFDESGHLVRNHDGYARWTAAYSGRGQRLDATYFDADDRALPVQVRVENVTAGGLGARLGLHVGDVLVRYDGQAIGSFARFFAMRRAERADDKPRPLEIRRNGKTLTLQAPPGSLGVRLRNALLSN